MQMILKVEGMSCQHCAARVQKALEAAGAKEVKVDVAKGEAAFEAEGDRQDYIDAVEDAGYDAE